MDAAIAALAGAAIGAIGSFGAAWLQQRHQTRRDLVKIATDLAVSDYGRLFERVSKTGGPIPPVAVYVAYHADVLNAIASNDFGPDAVKRIDERMAALLMAIPDRTRGR